MAAAQMGRAARPRRRGGLGVAGWAVLVVTSVIALFPMYWLFVNALTPITSNPPLTPILWPSWSLDNFRRLLQGNVYYVNWMLNSLIIATVVTLWHVLFDSMAGYAFAKRRFPGREVLFWMMLSTLMIPIHVTIIPLFIITNRLGLIDTLWAVILPGTANAFGIFLMRQYIQTLPSELEEASRIDGASEWQVFWNVILPLSRPALGALAIFTFVRHWNDFLWPLIALTRPQNYTLTVGVANLQGEFATDYGVIFAGASLAALPMIVFFFMFQRQFLEGVRMGAVKG